MSAYESAPRANERSLRAVDRPRAGRVLVIAPHADDEVLGCGGTLALHAAQSDEIQVVVVFDGALGLAQHVDPQVREAEALAGAQHLGRLAYEFWRYPEGHVPSQADLEPAIARLCERIQAFRPATIYAPWIDDDHRDHRAVASAVRAALERCSFRGDAWGFEVWSPLEPELVVDVTRVWPKKLAALREHRSQLAATDLEALTHGRATRRGAELAERGALAEAFASFGALSPIAQRPLAIAYVGQLDASEFRGGTERVVRGHLEALAALGHRVSSIAGSDRAHEGRDLIEDELPFAPDAANHLASAGSLRVVRIPRIATEPFDLALDRPRIRDLVVRSIATADIVHVHHWSTLCGDLVRSIARVKPVVVTLHDYFTTCPRFFRRSPDPTLVCPPRGEYGACASCVAPHAPSNSFAELERALRSRAANFEAELAAAGAVIAPSRALARSLAPLLGIEVSRVRILEHQSPAARAPRRPLDELGSRPRALPSSPMRVLHFGNLSRDKGTLDLVRALAPLPKGSVELVLSGPALESDLERAVERERGELQIEWRGPYDDAALRAAARSSDLAAFPSRLAESYGLVVDEARALGLPSWVSDRGALPERIGRAGRVLPAENPSAWTKAFEELLSRPAMLEEQTDALRSEPPRDFESTALELERLYRELLR